MSDTLIFVSVSSSNKRRMFMKFIFLSVVIVMIFGLFAYGCAPVGEEESSSSRIAFRSNRGGNQNSEIYLMDATARTSNA